MIYSVAFSTGLQVTTPSADTRISVGVESVIGSGGGLSVGVLHPTKDTIMPTAKIRLNNLFFIACLLFSFR